MISYALGSVLEMGNSENNQSRNWEIWLGQARRFVEAGKLVLDGSFHETAYYLALHAGELALKTVLVKDMIFEKSDEHHDMLELLDKIRDKKCLPAMVLWDVETIVEGGVEQMGDGLSHTDVGVAEQKIIDQASNMTSKIRYPIGSEAPYQYIDVTNTRKKIDLSEKLISVLEKHYAQPT